MKKIRSIFISIALIVLLMLTLCSCAPMMFGLFLNEFLSIPFDYDPTETHIHEFSDEWANNETHHWHECSYVNCIEISDYDRHTFEDGYCTFCSRENSISASISLE